MRTLMISFGMLLLFGGAFAFYLSMQPRTVVAPPPVASTMPTTRPRLSDSASAMPLGQGNDVWVKSYDKTTGELSSQFRASKYEPRDDGSVDVTGPQAEFYQGEQTIRITGSSGQVIMPPLQDGQVRTGGAQVPTRGVLRDVKIEMFDDSNPDSEEPDVVCDVNNIAFDNDTFRIYTTDYVDVAGRLVTANEVPVRVRGTKYDFDGYGLLVRWNERDRRLQLLEINRGERLLIKDPQGLGGAFQQTRIESPAGMLVSMDPELSKDAIAQMIAWQTPAPTIDPSPSTAPATQPRRPRRPPRRTPPASTTRALPRRDLSPAIYRATFFDNVHVTQGNIPVGDSDLMHVDFSPDGKAKPTTAPDKSPATAPVARNSSLRLPDVRPTIGGDSLFYASLVDDIPENAPATLPATMPTTTPTTRNIDAEPVEIRWTGKLRVGPPEKDSGAPALVPGDSAIQMVGVKAPVELRRDGGTIHCASFTYFTQSRKLNVRNSQTFPEITLADATGATVRTTAIDYSTDAGTAVLLGRSSARFVIAAKPTNSASTSQPATQAKPAEMLAEWNERCTLKFGAASGGKPSGIERALLEGDVKVDHPEMKLTSQRLNLRMTQSAKGNADLRELRADGTVKCTVTDDKKSERHFAAEHLQVATEAAPDGSRYPSVVNADGSVKAFDAEQMLECGMLEAVLLPTRINDSRSADGEQFKSLKASQDVKYSSTKGSTASGDKLNIETVDGQQVVTLAGQPFASVIDKTTTLKGPIIQFYPKNDHAEVIGGGTLRTQMTRDEKKSGTAEPIDIAWSRGVTVDGATNKIDFNGDVSMTTRSAEGATNVATGQHLTMFLSTDPTETKTKATGAAPATTPTQSLLGNSKFLAGRTLDKVMLSDNVEVKSELLDDKGEIIKRSHLFAPLIEYEVAIKAGPATRLSDGTVKAHPDRPARLVIPAAGRMLYQDNSKSVAAAANANPLVSGGGATGFYWKKSLIYDESTGKIVMTGDVDVIHQGSNDAEAYHITAPTMTAQLEAVPSTQPVVTTAPATAGGIAAVTNTQRLKEVRASGGVNFSSSRLEFQAGEVAYDPIKEEITASGQGNAPVVVTRANNLSTGSFSEVVWDAKNGRLVRMKDMNANVRR